MVDLPALIQMICVEPDLKALPAAGLYRNLPLLHKEALAVAMTTLKFQVFLSRKVVPVIEMLAWFVTAAFSRRQSIQTLYLQK